MNMDEMDPLQHETGLKRPLDESGDNGVGGKRLRKERGEGPHIDFRVLLASKNAGAIIGKGGANIKRLRTDFKASVTVPDSQGPERILTIGANIGTVMEVLLDIIPSFEEYQKLSGDFDVELRYLVHQSQAGCIIGRGGAKIKELREDTGCDIRVYSQCAPQSTERVVQLRAGVYQVVNCISTIHDLLQTAPPKGINQPYDPHNFDEFYAQEYGGYTSMDSMKGSGAGGGGGNMRGGPMGRGGPPGRGMRGRGASDAGGRTQDQRGRGGMPMGGGPMRGRGGFGMGMRGGFGGGDFGGRGGFRGRGRGGFGSMGGFGGRGGGMGGGGGGGMGGFGGSSGMGGFASDDNDTWGFGSSGGGGLFGSSGGSSGAGGGGSAERSSDGPTDSTQVSIPKDLAGAIIGKGGSRIRQIRQDSGAGITIDEALPGSNDRIITITGSQDQIQNAQYLLQMSAKQAQSRRDY